MWDRVVKDASCYHKNEQLNPPVSVMYFKGEVLWYLYIWCVYVYIEMLHLSVIVPNVTMVVYDIIFDGIHL